MSKFKRVFDAAKQRTADEKPTPIKEESDSSPTQATTSPPSQSRGRPKGKRSDPDYEQVTAYIRKETYRQVKIALLQESHSPEFSELVEDLLQTWLKERS